MDGILNIPYGMLMMPNEKIVHLLRYKWEYTAPEDDVSEFEWDFSSQYRAGYVNSSLIERREYLQGAVEECFDKLVSP
jgi:hypothetical protein